MFEKTDMKRTNFPFLISLVLLFVSLLSCQKEGPSTVIKGIVTNRTTGEPVAGAYIDCGIRIPEWPSPQTKDNSTYSDSEGKYRLEIPEGFSFSISNVYKLGFIPNAAPLYSIEVIDGETNIVDVVLIPTDGFIRLKIFNDLPENDSLYVHFISPTRAAQPYIGGALIPENLPYDLNFGSANEEVFALPSEEFVRVHWGYFPYSPIANSPFRDSVYVLRNDTVDFTIHF